MHVRERKEKMRALLEGNGTCFEITADGIRKKKNCCLSRRKENNSRTFAQMRFKLLFHSPIAGSERKKGNGSYCVLHGSSFSLVAFRYFKRTRERE